MVNGVILGKFDAFSETLLELKSLGKLTTAQLNANWERRKAVERNLQILVEIVIDVCQRMIALSGQPPASTGRNAVTRCVKMGILSASAPYEKMVQFRNFIVHRYEHINVDLLVAMVNKGLGDFEKFREEIIAYEPDHGK